MGELELATVADLYRTYRTDLAAVQEQQRGLLAANHSRMTPQLDDVEAELTYLLLRKLRPATVMELGTFHGWSTTWLLSALRDNGTGHLWSFDRTDTVVRNVPAELAGDRWTFVLGDVRANLGQVPPAVDYLFVDADHGRRFARWYLAHLFPLMPSGAAVSVHDVFHGHKPRVWSEGSVIVAWLRERGIGLFTVSGKHAPKSLDTIQQVRAALDLGPVRGTTANPMIYFTLP